MDAFQVTVSENGIRVSLQCLIHPPTAWPMCGERTISTVLIPFSPCQTSLGWWEFRGSKSNAFRGIGTFCAAMIRRTCPLF